jgi:HD-GYP domain-containing protein (c-di-GMP phosphodiesterase class II)
VTLGFVGADRDLQRRAAQVAVADLEFAAGLAERAAPLLERRDMLRLPVLVAIGRDFIDGRVLLSDRDGRVLIDTASVRGEDLLPPLAVDGAVQRLVGDGDEAGAPTASEARCLETAAPIRFGGERIGEVRIRRAPHLVGPGFDFGWFGLSLLGSLSAIAVAVALGAQWSARVRRATDAVIQLSAGQPCGLSVEGGSSELRGLGRALQELERGMSAVSRQAAEGCLSMAAALVDGLERRRLVMPGRAERVARLALRVADALQLAEPERRVLDQASRLVDLGKVWVRAALLTKQGPLDEGERESLRQHPLRAAECLERFPSLRKIAVVVRHQSERYDGLGLPDRLRGERIPLASRILAVVSAYDALTVAGERSVPWQAALERLARQRGEIFDPWLVDVLATELERDPPPIEVDREVAVMPAAATLFWPPVAEFGDDVAEDDEDDAIDELEVLLDDQDGDKTDS